MRLVVDVHPHQVGGMERFLSRLLPRLPALGIRPVALSGEAGEPLRLLAGLETRVVPGLWTGDVDEVERVLRELSPDLVQSDYFSPTLAWAARRAGFPHVWQVGSRVEVSAPGQGAPLLAIMAALSRRMICHSRFVAEQFRGLAEVEVLPAGVPLGSARTPTGRRVAMLAHLRPQKRHLDFLEAARGLGIGVAVYGGSGRSPADLAYRREVLAAAAGVAEIREFLGEPREVLEEVDLLVLPSLDEGFGVAVAEAMAAGLPVVAADSGALPELVEDGVTGLLVPPRSPEALADALRLLLEAPERAREMGRAGRQRAEERLDLDRLAPRYAAFYRRAVRAPGAPGGGGGPGA